MIKLMEKLENKKVVLIKKLPTIKSYKSKNILGYYSHKGIFYKY